MEQWNEASEKQAKALEECAIEYLRIPRTGCLEEGRRTALRVIKFGPGRSSVEVEELQV